LLVWLALIVLGFVFLLACLTFFAASPIPGSTQLTAIALAVWRLALIALYGISFAMILKRAPKGRFLGTISFALMSVATVWSLIALVNLPPYQSRYMSRITAEIVVAAQIGVSFLLLLGFLFSKQIQRYFEATRTPDDPPQDAPSH
jgi:hypothetical protein